MDSTHAASLIRNNFLFNKRALCFTIALHEIFLFRLVPGYVPWVSGYHRGSNSLKIYWSPIPEEDAHGVLLGYVVYFRRYGSSENFTTVKVNASTRVLRIIGLMEATTYEIKVAGRTSVGEGPLSTTYESTGWYLNSVVDNDGFPKKLSSLMC